MRKLGIVLAALACLSLMAIPAMAAKGEMTFGLNGGMSIPTGDFGKTDKATDTFGYKAGFGGGVFGDYMITDMFTVGIDAAYGQNKLKDPPAGFDSKVTIINFGAHVKVVAPMKDSPLSPYLQVGAGMYNGKAEFTEGSATSDTSMTKFGYNVGVGADYKVNPMIGVGLYGTFHSALDMLESSDANGNVTKKALNYIAVGVKVSFMTNGAGAAKK